MIDVHYGHLSDGTLMTGAYAFGPEAGEWLQQARLAIRARVPLEVMSDTIQPFPSFSGIFDPAFKALHGDSEDAPAHATDASAGSTGMSETRSALVTALAARPPQAGDRPDQLEVADDRASTAP